MHRYAVEDRQGRSAFRLDDRTIADIAPADIRIAYEVAAGSDVYANDQQFWILDLGERLMIVPEDVQGLEAWLQAHQPALVASGRWRRARCYMPPRAWREAWFGLIPRTRVKLCVAGRVDFGRVMPEWELLDNDKGKEVIG